MLVVGICLIVLAAILIFLHVSSRKRIAALLVAKQKRFNEITHEKDLLAKELGGGSYEEFVSFEGNAVCQQPLISPIANVPCVHYEATVSREYEEEYEERDQNGRLHRRTRRGSEIMSTQSESCPFAISDGQGQIMVQADGAKFDQLQNSANRFEPAQGGGAANGGLLMQFGLAMIDPRHGRRTLGYRYQEQVLPVGHITAVGQLREQMGGLTIGSGGMDFILSTKTRQEMIDSAKSSAKWTSIGSLVSFLIGLGVTIASFFVK